MLYSTQYYCLQRGMGKLAEVMQVWFYRMKYVKKMLSDVKTTKEDFSFTDSDNVPLLFQRMFPESVVVHKGIKHD